MIGLSLPLAIGVKAVLIRRNYVLTCPLLPCLEHISHPRDPLWRWALKLIYGGPLITIAVNFREGKGNTRVNLIYPEISGRDIQMIVDKGSDL